MDIWSWVYPRLDAVEEKEPRLGNLLRNLSHWTSEGQHDRIDAVWPEVQAGIGRLKDPWLEVYARHWRLQSLVLHRHDVRVGLPEAISLLERASRPDARDCPQAVCVAQDVCAAYSHRDDFGYGEERLAVSRETLDQIDPTWPCWRCIGAEHAAALGDLGRHEEALAFIASHHAAIKQAGGVLKPSDLVLSRAWALLRLGRHEEALQLLDGVRNEEGGSTWLMSREIVRAQLFVEMGRWREAQEVLPPHREIRLEASEWSGWCVVTVELLRQGVGELGEVMAWLSEFRRGLEERENSRDALEIALLQGRLAVERGRNLTARYALAAAGRIRTMLRKDGGADGEIAELRAGVLGMASPEVPTERAEAESWLQESEGVEEDELLALVERHPDWVEPHVLLARVCLWSGEAEFARGLLEPLREASEAFVPLASVFVELGDDDALRALLAEQSDEIAPVVFYRSVLLANEGDEDGAIEVLKSRQDDPRVRGRLVALLRGAGRLEEALDVLSAACGVGEPGVSEWNLIEVATQLGRWEWVREACARLGIELDGEEGPVEEYWGDCQVEVGSVRLRAERVGPARARVTSIRHDERVAYGDMWLLGTAPVEEGEDGNVYRGITRLEDGGYSMALVDGVMPDGGWDEARERLEAAGVLHLLRSDDDYQVADGGEGFVPGVYFWVLWREGEQGRVREALDALASPMLTYPELARALDDQALLDEHLALVERWGL